MFTIPSGTLGTTTITTGFFGAVFNGGGSGWYFCSTSPTNLIQNFIVGTTVAPQTSVIYNSDTFDKGSLTMSRLDFRTAPVSQPVGNTSLVTRWYIRSNSVNVGGGFFETEVYFHTAARVTTLANNQFFVNSVTATSFNNSGLNGAYITSFTQEATLGGFKATFRGKSILNATTPRGGDLGIFQISTLVYRIDTSTTGSYTPVVNDFIRIASRTNVNYITAVSSLGSNLYDLTLAYTEGALGSGFTYVITAPVTTTASLLQATAITGHLAQTLIIYTAGTTYSFYPTTNQYTAFSPINFNFYNQTNTSLLPRSYTIQSATTYNYITPLSITDYGRTTINFYNTQTITYFIFYDVLLPPNQANTTLVSVDAIQTLTNKTFDRIGLQTVTTQTSTELGYRVSNILPPTALAALTTWVAPASGNSITLPSQGIYLLTYSFSTRSAITVLMGCLSESSTAPAGAPQTSDAVVLAFCGSTTGTANWTTCSNTIIYPNTTANRIIYLYWSTTAAVTIKTNGNYFQAVRIA